ncbi:hypothetical protein SAMN04490200_5463 [Pseudomonas proteolytica]|nr:hypothetical protein SAMN04490200_3896 [Pseudomonas proteolytica]SEE79321.1 hypothetical protein SAMN04490200_5463 [Pseudomonas proteolytica]
MVRQYSFEDLMKRLTSDKVTVIKDKRGNFVFMPVAYRGRRL